MNKQTKKIKRISFFRPTSNESTEDIKNADALLFDIEATPHAFVLGCIMNSQMRDERAWIIPYKVFSAFSNMGLIKNNSINELAKVPLEKYKEVFSSYYDKSLHRFDYMAERFYKAILHIKEKYQGNAAKIWANKPSSKDIIEKFLEFDGVGPKIATTALDILFAQYNVDIIFYDHDRLRMLRKSLKINQSDFAIKIGMAQSSYSQIETGENSLTDKNISLISLIYGVSESWLRHGEGEMFDVASKPKDDDEKKLLEMFRTLPSEMREYVLRKVQECRRIDQD